MSSIATATKPAPEKGSGVKGMFKRLTIRLKRKGKEADGEDLPHDEVEVPIEGGSHDAAKHMQSMLGTHDIDDAAHQGKAKACTEDGAVAVDNKKKVEHLLRRSRKYELTKSASRGDIEVAEGDASSSPRKAKEEDSDANIAAVDEQVQAGGDEVDSSHKAAKDKSKHKKTKEEKKREKRERKEKRKSRRKSSKLPQAEADVGSAAPQPVVGQNDQPAEVQAVPVPEPVQPVVVPATGRPAGGLIRPLSCPPQRFNGEVSSYGLRAIADAIEDVASSIAPELQPHTPQMTLADFVEGELSNQQQEEAAVKKPNLPSFDLPPPPSPPRDARAHVIAADEALTAAAAEDRPEIVQQHFLLPKPTSYSSPLASTAAVVGLPQFTAVSDSSEPVAVLPSGKKRRGSSTTTSSSSGSQLRTQRRSSAGPVPTFTLFGSSPEPIKVPLLPIVLPAGAQKRKGVDETLDTDVEPTLVQDERDIAAPEAKYARLDSDQHPLPASAVRLAPELMELGKADSEAAFEAVPETVAAALVGDAVTSDVVNVDVVPKRKPSIRPDEIKILEQEQHRQQHQHQGSEVTIFISDGSSPESSPEPAHLAAPQQPLPHDEPAQQPSLAETPRQEAPSSIEEMEQIDAQRDKVMEDEPEAEENDDGEEEEDNNEDAGLGSQSSQAQANPKQQQQQQQQRQRQGSRRGRRGGRGKGKNRTLRKQGTNSRIAYR